MQKCFYLRLISGQTLKHILLLFAVGVLCGQVTRAQPVNSVQEANRKIVRQAFDDWAKGGTKFFDDILAADVEWTITGSSKSAGTYRGREEFISEAVRPFAARLSAPIVPKARQIFAEKDQVIILWDGSATAKDGKTYRNNYAWFFKMKNGRAVEVIAFLDLPAYEDVLRRIELPPEK